MTKTAAVDKSSSFTEINLTETEKKKVPKRLVYFSDGILEEYSTDEDEIDQANMETQPLIDPKTLSWIPYFGYLMLWMGARTLAVCDYLGENLAWFLGITSPKFQYELEQFEKMAKEEEELQKHIQAENAGWTRANGETSPVGKQPHLDESSKELLSQDITLTLNMDYGDGDHDKKF